MESVKDPGAKSPAPVYEVGVGTIRVFFFARSPAIVGDATPRMSSILAQQVCFNITGSNLRLDNARVVPLAPIVK